MKIKWKNRKECSFRINWSWLPDRVRNLDMKETKSESFFGAGISRAKIEKQNHQKLNLKVNFVFIFWALCRFLVFGKAHSEVNCC